MHDIIKRLQRMDQLIGRKGTGKPTQFAARLHVSERSLHQYIRLLKDLGAPITYSRSLETYYYESSGRFLISFIPDITVTTVQEVLNASNSI